MCAYYHDRIIYHLIWYYVSVRDSFFIFSQLFFLFHTTSDYESLDYYKIKQTQCFFSFVLLLRFGDLPARMSLNVKYIYIYTCILHIYIYVSVCVVIILCATKFKTSFRRYSMSASRGAYARLVRHSKLLLYDRVLVFVAYVCVWCAQYAFLC